MKTERGKIKVWDPVVRLFHWSLVGLVTIAFVTEDDVLWLHVSAGYMITGLLGLRLLWGLVGTRHARFSDFTFRLRTVTAYLKDMAALRARRYIGHGPAGGAMVLALLISLMVTVFSGFAVLGGEEYAGPLAGFMSGRAGFWVAAAEAVHEFFSGLTAFLIFFHVAGVVFSSLLHRENLVRSMVDGTKRSPDEDFSEPISENKEAAR